MSDLMGLLNISFCPGLLAVLKASSPPTIDWFLSLDTYVPKNVWAVYAVVLAKPKHKSILYIGSATAAQRGARGRLENYDAQTHLPRYIAKALRDGYTIQHKALLAWCSIPDAIHIPCCRTVIVGLEAVLAC